MSSGASPNSPPEQPTTTGIDARLSKFDDPCKAFKDLSARRQELISGAGLAEFEYHGNGTQRRLKYNLANITSLEQDIRQAQAECAASIGAPNPGRRFALTAGPKPEGVPAMRWSPRLGYY